MMFKSNTRNGEVESEKPSLEFGYDVAVPQDTRAAWGARTIAEEVPMSLLPDRQALCWRTKAARSRLVHLLNDGVLKKIKEEYSRLHSSGEIQNNRANEVVLYDGPKVRAVGNTNGSYGHFYVAAWLKEEG